MATRDYFDYAGTFGQAMQNLNMPTRMDRERDIQRADRTAELQRKREERALVDAERKSKKEEEKEARAQQVYAKLLESGKGGVPTMADLAQAALYTGNPRDAAAILNQMAQVEALKERTAAQVARAGRTGGGRSGGGAKGKAPARTLVFRSDRGPEKLPMEESVTPTAPMIEVAPAAPGLYPAEVPVPPAPPAALYGAPAPTARLSAPAATIPFPGLPAEPVLAQRPAGAAAPAMPLGPRRDAVPPTATAATEGGSGARLMMDEELDGELRSAIQKAMGAERAALQPRTVEDARALAQEADLASKGVWFQTLEGRPLTPEEHTDLLYSKYDAEGNPVISLAEDIKTMRETNKTLRPQDIDAMLSRRNVRRLRGAPMFAVQDKDILFIRQEDGSVAAMPTEQILENPELAAREGITGARTDAAGNISITRDPKGGPADRRQAAVANILKDMQTVMTGDPMSAPEKVRAILDMAPAVLRNSGLSRSDILRAQADLEDAAASFGGGLGGAVGGAAGTVADGAAGAAGIGVPARPETPVARKLTSLLGGNGFRVRSVSSLGEIPSTPAPAQPEARPAPTPEGVAAAVGAPPSDVAMTVVPPAAIPALAGYRAAPVPEMEGPPPPPVRGIIPTPVPASNTLEFDPTFGRGRPTGSAYMGWDEIKATRDALNAMRVKKGLAPIPY